MIQRLLGAAACALLLPAAVIAPALAQQSAGVTVIVNGQTMNFPQPPVEQAGRVFVPLRGIFEQLGASVVYQNGTINATGNGRNVSLHIGSTQATVNGQPETLDSPPFIENATTLVPLRFIAQALGASVNWNNNTSTVAIYSAHGHSASGYRGNAYNAPPEQPMNAGAYVTNREPVGMTRDRDPAISADFARPVRRDSVHVTLDGRDITGAVDVSSDGFQYTPDRPLYPGRHTIRVSGVTQEGASFSTSWDFTV
ncbi:MAG TPA: copper amine oxidase N-terminal domain-containing protein [Candidatus Baltobacteraceae bacterium]|nr:copper amine oxidase N-terminal domain-containing protein [Candidatus Baltobacteraceae bacterium]